jgi:hypothetical protein
VGLEPTRELETFVLELPASEQDSSPRRVGLLSLLDRRRAGEQRLEMEIHFTEDDLSIWHVENHSRGGRTLVWREGGSQALRAWIAHLPEDAGAIEIESWGLGEPARRELHPPRRVELPLEWLQRARSGPAAIGHRLWLSPLSARVERVRVEQVELGLAATSELPLLWEAWISAEAGGPWRVYRARRADGSNAGAWLFRGRRLQAFELQSGGLTARRIDAAEHADTLRGLRRPPAPTKIEQLGQWLDLSRTELAGPTVRSQREDVE